MLRFEGLPEIKHHEANCSMTEQVQTEEVKWSDNIQSLVISAQAFLGPLPQPHGSQEKAPSSPNGPSWLGKIGR